MHRSDRPRLSTQTRHAVQRQLTYSELGPKMASKKSPVAAQLVRALALRLNVKQLCPLTPVHIPGVENALTDIPSCSFSSVKNWECKSDDDLLTLLNKTFPSCNRPSERSSALAQK